MGLWSMLLGSNPGSPLASLTQEQRDSELVELGYKKTKLKKKMLGNINFIGELFNLTMISSKIILVQVRSRPFFRAFLSFVRSLLCKPLLHPNDLKIWKIASTVIF